VLAHIPRSHAERRHAFAIGQGDMFHVCVLVGAGGWLKAPLRVSQPPLTLGNTT
jgi:hypothetical protein